MKKLLLVFIFPLLGSIAVPAHDRDSVPIKRQIVVKNFIAPVALIGFGLYTKEEGHILNRFAVRDWRNENFSGFVNHADDAMQFLPIAFVYGLDLLNVKSKNDLLNRTLLFVKSELVVNGIVLFLKRTTDIRRPDETNDHSFPSGHTTQAFMAATFMHKELGGKSVWFSIGAYTMASTVGVFRVLNNKHWISDVLVGAGLGILGTNLVYATHRYKWGKRPDLTILPTYSNGPGLYVSFKIN